MIVAPLVLEAHAAHEASYEHADEGPKDWVEGQILKVCRFGLAIGDLCFAWVVAREEKRPGAHEKVGADQCRRDKDYCGAHCARSPRSEAGQRAGDQPEAPRLLPACAAIDYSECETSSEEAAHKAEHAHHEPEVALHYAAADHA